MTWLEYSIIISFRWALATLRDSAPQLPPARARKCPPLTCMREISLPYKTYIYFNIFSDEATARHLLGYFDVQELENRRGYIDEGSC